MTTRPAQYLSVHGHFYQPPRGNPVTGDIGTEPDAGKFRNWNERVTAESYRPNAEIGNFDRISFDIGDSLLTWLRKRAPETYQRILQADRLHHQKAKIGNAIGTTFHHVILPLRKLRQKRAQLFWGRAAFRHHFGRDAQGIWLPEMAIDLETLQLVKAAGYSYTIIAQGQVQEPVDSAGPYWVDLQNGEKLAVFVRNDELSNDLSFNVGRAGGAGHWTRNKLGGRRSYKGLLTLLAIGGETFGHHHLGEERFLHWLISHEAQAIGYRMVTLNEFIRDYPPRETITIREYSSWNSQYSIERWCFSRPWKAMLLRALDILMDEMDELYLDVVRPLGVHPWKLMDGYSTVWLGEMSGPEWLAEFAPGLKTEVQDRILGVLHAKTYMSKSFTSNTFDNDEFDSNGPRFAIANAAYAAQMAEVATGVVLAPQFRRNLTLVLSDKNALNGAQVYDWAYTQYLAPEPIDVPTAGAATVDTAAESQSPATAEIQTAPLADSAPAHEEASPAAHDTVLNGTSEMPQEEPPQATVEGSETAL